MAVLTFTSAIEVLIVGSVSSTILVIAVSVYGSRRERAPASLIGGQFEIVILLHKVT